MIWTISYREKNDGAEHVPTAKIIRRFRFIVKYPDWYPNFAAEKLIGQPYVTTELIEEL